MKTTFLMIICASTIIACGKKEESTNHVTATPKNQFPTNRYNYTNCSGNQATAFSQNRFCRDVQFNYNYQFSNQANFDSCDINSRRQVYLNNNCPGVWNPHLISKNFQTRQSNIYTCVLAHTSNTDYYSKKIIMNNKSFINHPDYTTIIDKTIEGNKTILAIRFYDHNHRFLGNRDLIFDSRNNSNQTQVTSLMNIGPKMTCWPMQRQGGYNTGSSSGSSFFSYSFSFGW